MNRKSTLILFLLAIGSLLNSSEKKPTSACNATITKPKISTTPKKDTKVTSPKLDRKEIFKPICQEEKYYSEHLPHPYQAPEPTFTVFLKPEIIDAPHKNDLYRPITLNETEQTYHHISSNREVFDKQIESSLKDVK